MVINTTHFFELCFLNRFLWSQSNIAHADDQMRLMKAVLLEINKLISRVSLRTCAAAGKFRAFFDAFNT